MSMNPRHLPRIIAGLVSLLMMMLGVLMGVSLFGVHFGFYNAYSLFVLDLASTLFHWYNQIAQYFYSAQEALWLILIVLLGVISIIKIPPHLRFLKPSGSASAEHYDVGSTGFHRSLRLLCLFLGGFMAGYTHLATSLPVGSDTLPYIYDLNSVLHSGFQWA